MKRRKLSPSLHPTSSSGDPQKRVNDILLCVEHKLKNEDKQGEALTILHGLLVEHGKSPIDIPRTCFSEASVALYSLAIIYLQKGRIDQADTILLELGFKYRLHEECFSRKPQSVTSYDPKFVKTADDVIPVTHLETLEAFFRPNSQFWRSHNYPDCGYFSYVFPNFTNTKPSNFIESIILEYIFPTVKAEFPEIQPVHCEWWAHSRDINGGSHQLHYDTDEGALKNTGSLAFPLVSTVLYFGNDGSPTIVTSKKIGEDASKSNAYLSFPLRNRLLIFEGNRLHGVVPKFMPGMENRKRLTFMVGFWSNDVSIASFKDERPKANMRLPDPHKVGWLCDLKSLQFTTNQSTWSQQARVANKSLSMINNVWVDMAKEARILCPSSKRVDSSRNIFIGKYFLRHLNDLDSDIALMAFDNNISVDEAVEQTHEWLLLYLCAIEFILREFDDSEDLKDDAQDIILSLTKRSQEVVEIICESRIWRDLLHDSLHCHCKNSYKLIATAILWNIMEFKNLNRVDNSGKGRPFQDICEEFRDQLIDLFCSTPADSNDFEGVKEMCAGALAHLNPSLSVRHKQVKSQVLEVLNMALKHHASMKDNVNQWNSKDISNPDSDSSLDDFTRAIEALQ